jgi:hypothetical protein
MSFELFACAPDLFFEPMIECHTLRMQDDQAVPLLASRLRASSNMLSVRASMSHEYDHTRSG